MNLGKKLTTLINAALRSGLPRGGKSHDRAFDNPEEQLKAIREALAQVEAKEREVAARLKETQARATAAAESDNRSEAMAQQRLARELEAHLQTQSTEAITLSRKLAAIEERLAEASEHSQDKIAAAQETITKAKTVGGKTETHTEEGPSTVEDEPPASEDDELTARKSRLSG